MRYSGHVLRSTIAIAKEAWHLGGYREREPARAAARTRPPTWVRELRHQWFGVGTAGCAATHSIHEACDFGCTACYLSGAANRTEPLPFAAVAEQLATVRRAMGPGANVQITSGEVTLLPREALARIVRHALSLQLDPMVMSHGQTFLRDPSYLEHLVAAGLYKIGLHVDTTQRGRDGHARPTREHELHTVRDQLAELIRTTRRRTGRPLVAAHTMTVTADNHADVAEVVRWTLRNADAFRMLSLQPTAEVGRTRERATRAGTVWSEVERGAGKPLSPHTFRMGHPQCNRLCLAFVVRFGTRIEVLEVARTGSSVDARFVDHLVGGALRHLYLDGCSRTQIVGRLLGLFARSPQYALTFPLYSLYRLAPELSWLPMFVRSAARGEASVRPFVFVAHDFMSSDQLDTPIGRERLDSCVFRLPVNGEMVSMCQLNGSGLRESLNRQLIPSSRLVR